MILSHRVALNGVQLDSIDSRIRVQGVECQQGKEQISTVSLFGGQGQRITNRHRDSMDVVVRFSIGIKKDNMQARNDVFERVCEWAEGGGWLTVNYKPERRLKVICAQLPPEGDLWEWNKVFAITFRACGVPYWQQDPPGRLMATGNRISRIIGVAGNARTVVDLEFKCTSGVCSTFTAFVAGNTITLTGLNLRSGQTLTIDHSDEGLLRIWVDGFSVLAKRTAASSDDLYVWPGTALVEVETQGTGALTISCAGRYA